MNSQPQEKWVVMTLLGYLNFIHFSTSLHHFISKAFSNSWYSL